MSKVVVICPIRDRFPEIISSMINQTYENWHLLLIHDGPNSTNLRELLNVICDSRITFIETEGPAEGQWGHPIRRWALKNLETLSPGAEYVLVTNDDNYHAKIYLQEMIKGFNEGIKATYCSHFVHSYMSPQPEGDYEYGVMNTKLELGYIDCACVVMKKEIAIESAWEDISHSSDWTYFKRVIDKYGEGSFKKVLGCLVVHA